MVNRSESTMNQLNESLKTTKEIADSLGVSKSTVYRYIKSNEIHESSQLGSAMLYDESIEKVIREGLGLSIESSSKSERIDTESIELVQKELIETLKNQVESQKEQLSIKDKQIAELQKSNDQFQQLLLYEQQRNTKLIEENIDKKKWWTWWK